MKEDENMKNRIYPREKYLSKICTSAILPRNLPTQIFD